MTTLSIEGFRGIRKLEINDLKPLTVFTGDNGAGKSTCLEAAFVLHGRTNALCVFPLQVRRGMGAFSAAGPSFLGLFAGGSAAGRAVISATTRNSARLSLELTIESSPEETVLLEQRDWSLERGDFVDPTNLKDVTTRAPLCFTARRNGKIENQSELVWVFNPPKSAQLMARGGKAGRPAALLMHPSGGTPPDDEDKQRYGDLRAAGRDGEVIEFMRQIDSRIADVEFLETSQTRFFRAKLADGRSLPLGMLGGGAINAFRLGVNLAHVSDGFLAIDEVENGIYNRRLSTLFRALVNHRKRLGTQVMLATHSHEALTAIVGAASEHDPDEFAVVHLRRDEHDDVRATTIAGRDAKSSIEHGYDLR